MGTGPITKRYGDRPHYKCDVSSHQARNSVRERGERRGQAPVIGSDECHTGHLGC